MKKNLSILVNIILLIMIISILLISIFWIPNMYNYFESLIIRSNNKFTMKVLYYGLSYLIITIAIIVFSLAFKFSIAIKNDKIFSIEISNILKIIAILILVDCILFSNCIIILLFLKEFFISPLLIFFCIIGYAISFMLFILCNYVKEASYLKEEAEYTL